MSWFHRDPGRLAGAVYGTILVTALVAAYSEYDESSSLDVLVAVVTSTIVLWLAHVYARVVSARMENPATPGLFKDAARHEAPVLEAAALPALILALGVARAFDDEVAADLAIGVGVVSLFGWGYAIGTREGRTPGGRLLSGAVNAAFGLAIVALKIAVH